LKIHISQNTAAAQLRCSEMFNNHFIVNCPLNVPVK